MILMEMSDDCETEMEQFNKYATTRKGKGSKYMCDDSSRGNRNGPDEYVVKKLDLLAALQEKGSFRERGYHLAAGRLRNHPKEIYKLEQLIELRGIGEKLAKKIVEIHRTGTHRRLEYKTPRDTAVAAFAEVYGIGPALSIDLWDHGAKTTDDLRDHPEKYGLHEAQILGLKYYKERIPREEVTALLKTAEAEAIKLDLKIRLFCMGFYRRGQPDSGDIDLLLTRDTTDGLDHTGYVKKLWKRLRKVGMAQHVLSEPSDGWDKLDAKVNGLCRLPKGGKMRRIEILGVPFSELPAALIYFTGNDYFNRSLGLKARHLGYRLNQRELYKDVSRARDGTKITEGVLVQGMDSEQIFNRLGVKWRPPEERMP
ncbi:hypothetical protein JCM8547_003760 [Rhodosporidiobolus lusitaniae]